MTLSGNSQGPVFLEAMHLARDKEGASDKDFVTLFGESIDEIDPYVTLASIFLFEMRDKGVSYSSTNEDVIGQIRKEVNIATDQSFELLKKGRKHWT